MIVDPADYSVVDGKIKPADLVRMSPQDLADAQIKTKLQEIAEQVFLVFVFPFCFHGANFSLLSRLKSTPSASRK
jgi:hypothetical protein